MYVEQIPAPVPQMQIPAATFVQVLMNTMLAAMQAPADKKPGV